MNKLLLIDGNSITYRAFYGTFYSNQKNLLKNPEGIPINAVFTVAHTIQNVIDKYHPTHILVAFDAGKKTIRHDKLETYKGNRQKTPEELIIQIPIVKEMLDKMKIKHYELSGIEADDIIGSLSSKYNKNNKVLVLSSDKDLYQLVSNNTSMIVPRNGYQKDLLINIDNFKEIVGYLPNQVPDFKGIVGDKSDNLPGVKGIGEKGAIKLIDQYGDLDTIYKNIDEIKGSAHEKLITDKKMAFLCKDLATIIRDVSVPFELNDLLINEVVSEEMISFFKKHNMKSLVNKYTKKQEKNSSDEKSLFDNLIL